MPLTYQESADLMNDMTFRGRIKVASVTYAEYILGELPAAPAHNTRYKWAQQTMASPDMVANQITPGVVMQPSVKEQGAKISDEDLQTAVETTVNQMI